MNNSIWTWPDAIQTKESIYHSNGVDLIAYGLRLLCQMIFGSTLTLPIFAFFLYFISGLHATMTG